MSFSHLHSSLFSPLHSLSSQTTEHSHTKENLASIATVFFPKKSSLDFLGKWEFPDQKLSSQAGLSDAASLYLDTLYTLWTWGFVSPCTLSSTRSRSWLINRLFGFVDIHDEGSIRLHLHCAYTTTWTLSQSLKKASRYLSTLPYIPPSGTSEKYLPKLPPFSKVVQ